MKLASVCNSTSSTCTATVACRPSRSRTFVDTFRQPCLGIRKCTVNRNHGSATATSSHLHRVHQRGPAPLRAFSLDDLDIPDIDADLKSVQEDLSGGLADFSDNGIPLSFGNDKEAIAALSSGAVVVDASHWGRLRFAGDGRLTFLHNQSTNCFTDLAPGQGCDTVFVNAQARTIDLASCIVQRNGVLVIVSPGSAGALKERLEKFIFKDDKVAISDISDKCKMFVVAGPASHNVLEGLGAGDIIRAPHLTHSLFNQEGKPVIVASGSGLVSEGYTIIVDEAGAADLWKTLTTMGAVPMGEKMWEYARVQQGRPMPGSELTDDYNPLEAGLYRAVSINKGCYIGQETIAKVHNLRAVKQRLWGLKLGGVASPGNAIISGGIKIGTVTSVCETPTGEYIGLGYVNAKRGGVPVNVEGIEVEVNAKKGTIVDIPYATRGFLGEDISGEAEGEELAERVAEARRLKEELDEQLAAEKAAKLAAMEARMEAWRQQQAAAGGAAPAPDS